MKHIILFIFAAMALILSSSQCKKGGEEFGPDDTYFRCKINGQTYIPNNCANCITCTIYQDTIFMLGGNAGFETLGIGINDSEGIYAKDYILDDRIGRQGDYKNSTILNDRYFTDKSHTGKLVIESIDKGSRIIKGTFYFKAYNVYRNDSVNITDGRFRLKYTTN